MTDTVPAMVGSFGEFTVLVCDAQPAIPHLHLVKNFPELPEWQARIRLDRSEYVAKERQLNTTGKRRLMKFLAARGKSNSSRWKEIVSFWNYYNPQNKIDTDRPVPDYTRLPDDLSQDFDRGGGLTQECTGLPMVIYVTDCKFEMDHDQPPRVYVQTNHSSKTNPRSTVGISISVGSLKRDASGLSPIRQRSKAFNSGWRLAERE
jgi:hypothetical protein